jgi:hypothetical protein
MPDRPLSAGAAEADSPGWLPAFLPLIARAATGDPRAINRCLKPNEAEFAAR